MITRIMNQNPLNFLRTDEEVCVNLNLLNNSNKNLATAGQNASFTCTQRSVDSDIYSDSYLINLLAREPFKMTKSIPHSSGLKMSIIGQNTNNSAKVSRQSRKRGLRKPRYGCKRKIRRNFYLCAKPGSFNKNKAIEKNTTDGELNESNAKGDPNTTESDPCKTTVSLQQPSRLSRFNIFSKLSAFASRLYKPKSVNYKLKNSSNNQNTNKSKTCFFCGANCGSTKNQSNSNTSSNNCHNETPAAAKESSTSFGVKLTNTLGARAGQNLSNAESLYEYRPNVEAEMRRLSLNIQKPRLSWLPWFRSNETPSSESTEEKLKSSNNEQSQHHSTANANRNDRRCKRRRSLSSERSQKRRPLSCRSRSRTRR